MLLFHSLHLALTHLLFSHTASWYDIDVVMWKQNKTFFLCGYIRSLLHSCTVHFLYCIAVLIPFYCCNTSVTCSHCCCCTPFFFSCSFSHISVIFFSDSTLLCQLYVPCITWQLKILWSSGCTWALLASRTVPCITNSCVICILCCGVLRTSVCFTLISLLYAVVQCLESLFSCATNACPLTACTPKAAECMLQPFCFSLLCCCSGFESFSLKLFHVSISLCAQVTCFLTCVLLVASGNVRDMI